MLLTNVVLDVEREFGFLGSFAIFTVVVGIVLPSLPSSRSMIPPVEVGEGIAVTAEQFFFEATLGFFFANPVLPDEDDGA